MKTIEPVDDSDSTSSSSSGWPVRMIDDVEWKTNQSFFKNEDEESSEEVKSLTEEEIEEVDIFLGELEYFQNFFNLNEYDKRAGYYLSCSITRGDTLILVKKFLTWIRLNNAPRRSTVFQKIKIISSGLYNGWESQKNDILDFCNNQNRLINTCSM